MDDREKRSNTETQNPLRELFLSLSRMPPVLMLFIILGMSIVVTMYVRGAVDSNERAQMGQQAVQNGSNVAPAAAVVYARNYIPAGSKIESKQLELRGVDPLEQWSDALKSVADIEGRTAKHGIPQHAQVRQIDLE